MFDDARNVVFDNRFSGRIKLLLQVLLYFRLKFFKFGPQFSQSLFKQRFLRPEQGTPVILAKGRCKVVPYLVGLEICSNVVQPAPEFARLGTDRDNAADIASRRFRRRAAGVARASEL
jgi:hypothetical protein